VINVGMGQKKSANISGMHRELIKGKLRIMGVVEGKVLGIGLNKLNRMGSGV